MKKLTFSFLIALALHIIVLGMSGFIIGDKQKTFFEYQNLIPVQFGGAEGAPKLQKESISTASEKKIEQVIIKEESDESNNSKGDRSGLAIGSSSGSTEVSSASFESVIVNYKKPNYPRIAQQRGLEGSVRVQIKVSVDGVAEETFILKSSGHEVLDKAVLDIVHEWSFQKNNRPYTVEKNVAFELKN